MQIGRCGGHGGHAAVKIVGIVAVAAVLGLAVVKDAVWDTASDTVQVVGQGRVPVAPDAALVNFGVLTIREDTSDLAIRKTSETLARIDEALAQAGVPKENRQITGYVLNPRFKDAPTDDNGVTTGAPTIDGYTASQQITVLVPGIKDQAGRVNEIVAIATKAGANQVGEVKMVATNAEALKQQARLKALADANEKAKAMASVVGMRLGSVSSWNESVLAAPGSQYNDNYGNTAMDNSTQASIQPSAPSSIIVLQPGQLDVVVELTVYYDVKR